MTSLGRRIHRLFRFRNPLSRAVADEHGISLLLALITLLALGTLGGSVAVYTTSQLHSSYSDQSAVGAYQLAEAGLNDAMSILESGDPTDTTLLPSTTVAYPNYGGSVTYAGTAATQTNPDGSNEVVWTVTSTGTAGASTSQLNRTDLTRKRILRQSVVVHGLVDGGNLGSWSRFYQDDDSQCLTIDTVSMPTNIATRGPLCLINGGSLTGAGTSIDVGGNVSITGPVVTTSVHYPSAGAGWTNPTNVYSNNSVYATNVIAAASTGANQDSTGFGFAIAPGAKILGIAVSVEKMASACCNAVQTISTSGTPTGGSFKLSGTPPGGSATTSTSIAYNASASTVQTDLVSIYGSGNVVCSGGNLPTAIVCTFQGSDASKAVTLMSQYSNSLTGGSSPKPVFTNTTVGSNGALQDSTVQLLKAGAPVGSNKASATTWSTSATAVNYGGSADLWGTTWTAADLNASNFGLRFAAKNVAAASATASIDYVSITVTYNDDTNGIGTPTTPILDAQIGGTCTYNGQPAHNPCSSADHVYATTIENTAPNDNTDLTMPHPDFEYWFLNAEPGPKHFCTNSNNNMSPMKFDNDNSTTSNDSLVFNDDPALDMAPLTKSYDCVFVENGVTVGEIGWNYQTHVLTIKGTIFYDGDVRFDNDGEVVHYSGRGIIYAAGAVEFDALVCAGGTGTTSCIGNMSSWDPKKNYLVLYAAKDSEYDQGGSNCSNLLPGATCNGSHPASGFQGVVSSQGDCLIHERFQLSGPVICNTISLPYESDGWPTYYPFPSLSQLVNGQKYGDVNNAQAFEVVPGPQTG